MNLILCDDEQLFITSIKQKILDWAKKNGHSNGLMLYSYTSGEDLLDAWQHGMQIDAMFLDIQIPGEMNGLAVAKAVRSTNPYLPIVFVTSYGEYAEEGYVVNALRYLRKPVSEQAVAECMNILWHRWELQHTDCIVLDMPTQVLRLPVHSILYVEVVGHYSIIKTADREQEYRLKKPMVAILNMLPAPLFVQCHRSYIANLMYVRHITSRNLTMADGTVIQIGKNYQAQLMKQFREYYLEGRNEMC